MGEKREEMQRRQKTRKTNDIRIRTESIRENWKTRRCETRTGLLSRLKDGKEGGGDLCGVCSVLMESCSFLRNNPEEIGVPCIKEYASM